ncbi:hypothetical protein [Streptomyces goshikiensis]|uniref:hypothetical protein n=1 Tax=Streptomyces goshikiensis TaxID=1942 RepID=UPI00364F8AD1
MLAGYNSPEDALDAVKAMPKADQLDSKTYVADCNRAVAAYQDQLGRAAQEARGCRRCQEGHGRQETGSLHAVG